MMESSKQHLPDKENPMFVIMNAFAPILNLVSRLFGRNDKYVVFHGEPALGRYWVIPAKGE